MDVLTFHIEDFDGPLDLLLHLVGKNKMNLYDINIMELIDQYTAAIASMQDRMEVSSEFIDMAAHLVQMKSALLLPARSQEAERMKAELTGRPESNTAPASGSPLSWAAVRATCIRRCARRCRWTARPNTPRPQDPDRLVQAWYSLMGRSLRRKKPSQERFTVERCVVTAPFVSVGSRVMHVLRGMLRGTLHRMGQLFSKNESRSTNVATFLALLELIRAGRVRIGAEGQLAVERRHLRHKTGEGQSE